ncbi:MAG TPA: serine hydrolase [Paludibacter sp.]|nr:serine hydrolase [Paludibacter sp.]
MKKYTKVITIVLLLYSVAAKAQTGTFVPELAKFDTAMLNLISQYNIPGAQLAITYQGRIVYNRGFGYADTLSHTPVQPGNVFRIASLTKPITCIAIMYLYEHGLLNLDDKVFGPDGILNDPAFQEIQDPNVAKITIRHLLTHSAGWDSNISGDPVFNPYNIAIAMNVPPPADPEAIVKFVLARHTLDFEPGTQFQYSNFGFCVLGRVIEKITGESYENFVRNTILGPLGISDMYSGKNLKDNRLKNEVVYYDYTGAPLTKSVYDNVTLVPWPYGGINIEGMDSNGGWLASAGDLCKLLLGIDGLPATTDIISQETNDIMSQPTNINSSYALGWGIDPQKNLWHRGSIQGTTTEMVRGSNQVNWALLLNSRPADASQLNSAVDNFVWNLIPSIGKWPAGDIPTAIGNQDNHSQTGIYPNPSNGRFTIHSNSPFDSVTIYDTRGEIVGSVKAGNNKAGFINVSYLPKGVYFLQIGNGQDLRTVKIIIE